MPEGRIQHNGQVYTAVQLDADHLFGVFDLCRLIN